MAGVPWEFGARMDTLPRLGSLTSSRYPMHALSYSRGMDDERLPQMIDITPTSRQPQRVPWTMDLLVRERAIALGLAHDPNSSTTCTSALNSYLTFLTIG
ncbi:hypothetical protein B0H10DRAFT_2082264 [Mycena sp. CBHHK59/15]|nr:hypothetical protein B0H10DRAFT_2082264 [Mycena sp. CBHHK59/15]